MALRSAPPERMRNRRAPGGMPGFALLDPAPREIRALLSPTYGGQLPTADYRLYSALLNTRSS